MKHTKHVLPAIVAGLLIVGCATTDEVITDSSPRTPTTSVEVFKDKREPGHGYKEIAELSFLGPREDELRAQKRFVERAKKLGGNAVLFSVLPAGQRGGGSMYGFNNSTAWVFKGKIVVYE